MSFAKFFKHKKRRSSNHELMKLLHIESDHWSIKVSDVYSDWQRASQVQIKVFHTTYYHILLIGDYEVEPTIFCMLN